MVPHLALKKAGIRAHRPPNSAPDAAMTASSTGEGSLSYQKRAK